MYKDFNTGKLIPLTEPTILRQCGDWRQGKTIFSCDSCVINNRMKTFEAFGHVHIYDTDTTHIYSDHMRYLTDKRIAYFNHQVRAHRRSWSSYYGRPEYDEYARSASIKWRQGRKQKQYSPAVVAGYYTDLKDVYFKNHVELKDPAYYMCRFIALQYANRKDCVYC